MTTSAIPRLQFDVRSSARIPSATLGYFEARLSGLVHQLLLELYGNLEHECDFTRRTLAHRIGRRPEQITRWLSYPTNLTLETMSDVLVGLGYEFESIVLANLLTGERVHFPNRLSTDPQTSTQPARLQSSHSEIADRQSMEISLPGKLADEPSKLAAAALAPKPPGKAESDQMNVHNSSYKQISMQSYAA